MNEMLKRIFCVNFLCSGRNRTSQPALNVLESDVNQQRGDSLPLREGISLSTFDNPHSCIYCRRLVLHEDSSRERWDEKNRKKFMISDLTLSDVKEASNHGCPLGQILLSQWKLVRQELQQHVVLWFQVHKTGRYGPDTIEFGLWGKEMWLPTARYNELLFPVWTSSGDPAGQQILTRPINTKPSSISSLQLIHTWMSECLQSHTECKALQTNFMPSRLIEIVKEDDEWHVKLRCNTGGLDAAYTALSYCWGPAQQMHVKTTRDTLQAWEASLPLDQLPKTIKDAILITHQLHIQFLWVDALCIIQDDKEDTAREISQMPHIYGQAIFTIAAARAESVQDGFLHDRVITHSTNPIFDVPFRCHNGEIGTVTLLDPDFPPYREPLNTRAWAMQERLLAPRVLEYGTRQTRWTCWSNMKGYEDGWTPHAESGFGRHDFLPRYVVLPDNTLLDEACRPRKFEMVREWYQLRYRYTQCQLSVESDRILAISGLAEKFAVALHDQYLAGLWKSTLPSDLLWIVISGPDSLRARPRKYQAPSWSWASVNGVVAVAQHDPGSSNRLELINCHIQLTNRAAPFGAVHSGVLAVRGRTQPAEWGSKPYFSEKGNLLRLRGAERQDSVLPIEMHPDALEDDFVSARWVPVVLLQVFRSPGDDNIRYLGLVLRETDCHTYTRLGLFSFWKDQPPNPITESRKKSYSWLSTWFDDCEPRIINIE